MTRRLKPELTSLRCGKVNLKWTYRGRRNTGHIVTAERLLDGSMRLYDPQTGEITTLDKITDRVKLSHGVRILRVDDLLVNSDIVKGAVEGY